MKQLGLFGLSKRLQDLSESGDPLEKLKEIINFELFRDELEKGLNFSEGLKCVIHRHGFKKIIDYWGHGSDLKSQIKMGRAI